MLEIKNLCASIREREIVHNVSAEFREGQVSVLLGPNGSGKSTILRSILRLTDVTGGDLLINGRSTSEMTPKEVAQRIAYMPQSRNASDITVKRLVLHGRFPYLSYPRKYRKMDMEIVNRILKELEIDNLADRYLTQLSGGQRQRVYIAMALAQETETILMDEPATFLDIQSQLEVMEIVTSLAKTGKNVIMVLHDFESVLRYADKVFLVNDGKIITSGIAETVLASEDVERIFGVKVCLIDGDDGRHCYVTKCRKETKIGS